MKKIFLIVLVLFSILLCSCNLSKVYYKKGNLKFKKQDYQGAITNFTKVFFFTEKLQAINEGFNM